MWDDALVMPSVFGFALGLDFRALRAEDLYILSM